VFVINAMVMLPYVVATRGWMLLPAFAAAGLVTAGADLATLYTLIGLAGPERVRDTTALNATFAGVRGLGGAISRPAAGTGWLAVVVGLCAVRAAHPGRRGGLGVHCQAPRIGAVEQRVIVSRPAGATASAD
jgi:hypothetical protein